MYRNLTSLSVIRLEASLLTSPTTGGADFITRMAITKKDHRIIPWMEAIILKHLSPTTLEANFHLQ